MTTADTSAGTGVEGVGQGGVEVEGCLQRNNLQFRDGARLRIQHDRQMTAAIDGVFKTGL